MASSWRVERQKRALGSASTGKRIRMGALKGSALVRHCVFTGFLCLPTAADRAFSAKSTRLVRRIKRVTCTPVFAIGAIERSGIDVKQKPISCPARKRVRRLRIAPSSFLKRIRCTKFPMQQPAVSSRVLVHGFTRKHRRDSGRSIVWGGIFELGQSGFSISYRNLPAPRDSGAGPAPPLSGPVS